jgi:hypothetical protein
MTMRGLAVVLFCCCLTGCGSRPEKDQANAVPDTSPKAAIRYLEQQRRLFHEIDHKLVYQSCEELLRSHREGKLSATTYYCDDPPTKLSELPEGVRKLEPTAVQVDEMMVRMTFLSDDGVQYLHCASNEFGEPTPSEDGMRGFGIRKNPYSMERLSGTESLEYLNANFDHFNVSLLPGLTYEVFSDKLPRTLEEVKRANDGMENALASMREVMKELAVKQQRLLYKTDHPALLKACREAINRFNEGAFSTSKIDMWPNELLKKMTHIDRETYAKDLEQIPQIILDLEPVYLWFEENGVTVALIGGFGHAGVFADLNDADAQARDDDMKLIDGLRYYDDGLREGGEEYKEYLKSLEREAIAPMDWRRKHMNTALRNEK